MLQDIRQIRGFTQKCLAEKTNIPIQTIQKYESGYANINNAKLDTLLTLCLVLDCSIEDLLTTPAMKLKFLKYIEKEHH